MPTPSAPPPEPAPEQVGPYRIVGELGRGGMGIVYDAEDTRQGRRVALKLVVGGLADDPGTRARFVREARVQAAVDSPHVVRVLAHGEAGGRLFLATELAPDGDLGAYLRSHGGLAERAAVDLVAQVADALAAVHRAGLVHRDVKASNVLLRHRGTHTDALLGDFGIAAPATPADEEADVRASAALLSAALADPPGAALARLLADPPATAELLRDALRDLAAAPCRPRRFRRRQVAAAAAAVAAAAVLPAAVAVDVANRRAQVFGHDDSDRLARVLREDAGLDAATSRCVVRRLTGEPETPDRETVLAAAAACLWEVSAGGPA